MENRAFFNNKVKQLRITLKKSRPSQYFVNCYQVKVEILLILCPFWGGFLDAPLFRTFICNLIAWYMEGTQEVYIWAKFHVCVICSSRAFKFQIFSQQQKVPFQAASWWFFFYTYNPLECGQICFKFCLPMQCEVIHQIFDNFYSISKKWSKLGQKTDFLAHFLEVFSLHSLTPYGLHPNNLPNERSHEDT